MEQVLVRIPWLIVVAFVAFVAVGCGTSSPPPAAVDVATPEEAANTGSEASVPVVAATGRIPTPVLAINPQPALQSGQVHVTGKGFGPGESVSISVGKSADAGSERLALATAVASDDGSFSTDSATLTLPDELLSGAHPLDAIGQTSGRRGTATLWIRAPQPWLVLDSYDVPQYGDLGLVAGGFEPMDQVKVSLEPAAGTTGSAVSLVGLTTDQAGNAAWTQVKLPSLAAGTYSMVLRGQSNAAELRRDVHVTPLKPTVELSPWAGPPGVPVQFNARGFAPNEHIHVSVGGAVDTTGLQADEWGNLWGAGPIHIPQTASTGTLALNLVGDESNATSSAEFKVLDPKPWLELTSWSGAPGAPVGFGGGGWIGGEPVSIHIGSATNPAQASGTADDNGWLKVASPVYVPNDAEDTVIFVAVGERSHLVSAATFTVVLPFGLRPGQSQPPQVPQVKTGG